MTGISRKDLINFLKDTLIPDLVESGSEFTAMDFSRAVMFMEDPKLEFANDTKAEFLAKELHKRRYK